MLCNRKYWDTNLYVGRHNSAKKRRFLTWLLNRKMPEFLSNFTISQRRCKLFSFWKFLSKLQGFKRAHPLFRHAASWKFLYCIHCQSMWAWQKRTGNFSLWRRLTAVARKLFLLWFLNTGSGNDLGNDPGFHNDSAGFFDYRRGPTNQGPVT